MSGFLLLDKPPGPTSHDIVDQVRRTTGERRVGHAGTLDPFASGLLIVGVGREATRELDRFLKLDKTYEATIALGATSDTDDREGMLTDITPASWPTAEQIDHMMQRFVGRIEQRPPSYAAIKIKGKKMYELARAGATVEAAPRSVTVHAFERISDLGFDRPSGGLGTGCPTASLRSNESVGLAPNWGPTRLMHFRATISCSSGTYIRAIARDLGAALGTGGFLQELRRTKIGPFSVSEASDTLIPIHELLSRLPSSGTIPTDLNS